MVAVQGPCARRSERIDKGSDRRGKWHAARRETRLDEAKGQRQRDNDDDNDDDDDDDNDDDDDDDDDDVDDVYIDACSVSENYSAKSVPRTRAHGKLRRAAASPRFIIALSSRGDCRWR
jgi:hypothetical protein